MHPPPELELDDLAPVLVVAPPVPLLVAGWPLLVDAAPAPLPVVVSDMVPPVPPGPSKLPANKAQLPLVAQSTTANGAHRRQAMALI
jgi:hypothetical protein